METATSNAYNMRSWVWKCTPESTDNETISILACVDTLTACGLSLWIAFQYDIWLHIGISALIAPLLLLRTPYSIEIGISWLNQTSDKAINVLDKIRVEPTKRVLGDLLLITILIIVGLLSISIRISATVVGLLKHPIITISNIPTNWKRIALYTDFLHPPEIIPGIESKVATEEKHNTLSDLLVSKYIYGAWTEIEDQNIIRKTILLLLFLLVFTLLYIPSLIYRWSLKSTSIVYVPLIYFSQLSYKPNTPRNRAEKILKQKFQLIWAIGGVIICLTLVPILLATFTNWLANYIIEGSWARDIMNFFTFVPAMERWNVARLACAIITVLMFVIAKKFIDATQNSSNQTPPISTFITDLTDLSLRTLNLIRGIGVLYIITCALIIFWSKIRDIDWILPAIGQDWFPRLN